jgi:periplasmic protein TonB
MTSNDILRRFWTVIAAVAVSLPLLAAAAEKPVKGDPPEFPSEANRAGFDEGRLKVRLSVEPNGEVNRVEVIDAVPRRVFDRATVRALSQWRYAATGTPRVLEIDVHYRR